MSFFSKDPNNLRPVHRHLRNGDALTLASVANPRIRELLAAKYATVPTEWVPSTAKSILRDKMEPIDRTVVYVEDSMSSSLIF